MMEQYPLYGGTPPHEQTATSKAAAESIRPHYGRLQQMALEVFRRRGAEGATDDELEQVTGIRHQSISARRRELVQLARIVKTDRTRKTRSGRAAAVYVLSEFAVAHALP